MQPIPTELPRHIQVDHTPLSYIDVPADIITTPPEELRTDLRPPKPNPGSYSTQLNGMKTFIPSKTPTTFKEAIDYACTGFPLDDQVPIYYGEYQPPGSDKMVRIYYNCDRNKTFTDIETEKVKICLSWAGGALVGAIILFVVLRVYIYPALTTKKYLIGFILFTVALVLFTFYYCRLRLSRPVYKKLWPVFRP